MTEPSEKNFLIWGTGELAAECASHIKSGKVIAYVESAPSKKFHEGAPIISPDEIKQWEYDYILIANHCPREVFDLCRQRDIDRDTILPIMPVLHFSMELWDEWLKLAGVVEEGYWKNLALRTFPHFLEAEIKENLCRSLLPVLFREYYKNSNDPEIKAMVEHVERKKKVSMINYDFTLSSPHTEIAITFDDSCQMYYVQDENNRMYFPRHWTRERVNRYYQDVCIIEQGKGSPHSYHMDGFEVCPGDIIVDAGAAEGSFTLARIGLVKKALLIECDERWQEALQFTFRPYKNKVEFIDKILCDCDDTNHLTLDCLGEKRNFDYVKMDIEGAELSALAGARRIMRERNIRWAVCAYHRKSDYDEIQRCLSKAGFQIKPQTGWIFASEALFDVDLRRGVLFAKKEGESDEAISSFHMHTEL